MIVGVCNLGPDHLYHTGASLNQPAGQQTALPKGIPTVEITSRILFLAQIEGLPRSPRRDQVQGAVIVGVKVVFLNGLVDDRHGLVDGIAKQSSAFKPHSEHIRSHFQIIHANSRHLLHVHIIARRIKGVWIVSFSEEPCRPSLTHYPTFLQGSR